MNWTLKRSCYLGLVLAWVMWVRFGDVRGSKPQLTEWDPQEGFETGADCQSSLQKWLDQFKKEKDSKIIGGSVIHKGGLYVERRCLPDSVDPRGKEK